MRMVQQQQPHREQPQPPLLSYRLTAPPYADWAQEYAHLKLGKLLEPENQRLLREDAMGIPQWTAWPEEQHYRVPEGDGNSSSTPWTVFPLCHCFPAHDASQLTWVPATANCVPHTVRLLQECCGADLRTALWSRLDAGALLEAHTGWADLANFVLRVHVPVMIPSQSLLRHVGGRLRRSARARPTARL